MSNRIYLKKFIPENDFSYYNMLCKNEKVMNMNFGRIFTDEEIEITFKQLSNNHTTSEDFGSFTVFEISSNKFMGLGTIYIRDDSAEAEVEYMLLPEYWGQGFGTELLSLLLAKITSNNKIKKVIAYIDPNNIASRRLLINQGFVSEKVFKTTDNSDAELLYKTI